MEWVFDSLEKLYDDLAIYGNKYYDSIKIIIFIFLVSLAFVFTIDLNPFGIVLNFSKFYYIPAFLIFLVFVDFLFRYIFSYELPKYSYLAFFFLGLGFSVNFLEYSILNSLSVHFFKTVSKHLLPKGVEGITTTVTGGIRANLYMSVLLSALVTFPVACREFWKNVTPILTRKSEKISVEVEGEEVEINVNNIKDCEVGGGEKELFEKYFFPSIGLFFFGSLISVFLFLPIAFNFLFKWPQALGFTGKVTPINLITFALWCTFAVGLVFETPIIMNVLTYTGMVSYERWKKLAPIIIGIMWWVFAFVSPADLMTCLMMWIPFIILYLIGLYLSKDKGGET